MAGRRGDFKYLVVDDEPLIGAAFERVLFPGQVARCTSGEDAVLLLEKRTHFDAIVSDLMLPAMNGVRLYGWIELHRPELCGHVVFMTGSPHSKLAREARRLSKYPLLVKPFNLADVRRAVTEATGQSFLK